MNLDRRRLSTDTDLARFACGSCGKADSARGGFNSNQLLPYLNYDLIASHPKNSVRFSTLRHSRAPSCQNRSGYLQRTELLHFGRDFGMDYTTRYFEQCLIQDEPIIIAE